MASTNNIQYIHCEQTFITVEACKTHAKMVRQCTVTVTMMDGSELELQQVDGEFHCPCGQVQYACPHSIQRHTKKCQGARPMGMFLSLFYVKEN